MQKRCNGKIRVAHIIGSAGLYGAERWILALMRGHVDQVDSTLINLMDEQDGNSDVVVSAKQRGLDAFDFYTGGKFNPLVVLRLARWARKQRIEILHGHGFKSDAICLMTARLAGCKVISTPHGWSLDADIKLRCYETLDRMIFRFMDMICPLSPELARGLAKFIKKEHVSLIANGVDIEEVQAIPPVENLNQGGFVLGYIGRLVKGKDLPTLFAAMKILTTETEVNLCLYLIGDGPEQEALREEADKLQLGNNIYFKGFMPDAAAWLKSFDVFVLPSLSEGIPRCVMEAMAADIPVVASDIPGNRNLIVHSETGLLFSPGNSQELAREILTMISCPEKAIAMAQRARQKVESEYSSRRMAGEYTFLYCELLGRGTV